MRFIDQALSALNRLRQVMPKRKEELKKLEDEKAQEIQNAGGQEEEEKKVNEKYSKLIKELGPVVEKEILDKVEADLIRAKETGNVSYDIKSSLNDPGYAPAIEAILKEIQTPQIIPVEIKEGVGVVSAKIREEEQKQLFAKQEEEAKRIVAQREEFKKLAEEEKQSKQEYLDAFDQEIQKLNIPQFVNVSQFGSIGYEQFSKTKKKDGDKNKSIENQIINISKSILPGFEELVKRAQNIGDKTLSESISEYLDSIDIGAIDKTKALEIIKKYNDENDKINKQEDVIKSE